MWGGGGGGVLGVPVGKGNVGPYPITPQMRGYLKKVEILFKLWDVRVSSVQDKPYCDWSEKWSKKVPVQTNKIKIKCAFVKKERSGRNIKVFHTICFYFFFCCKVPIWYCALNVVRFGCMTLCRMSSAVPTPTLCPSWTVSSRYNTLQMLPI